MSDIVPIAHGIVRNALDLITDEDGLRLALEAVDRLFSNEQVVQEFIDREAQFNKVIGEYKDRVTELVGRLAPQPQQIVPLPQSETSVIPDNVLQFQQRDTTNAPRG